MSRHGEANVCETRADAQEPAAQTRRLAASVGVSSAPRSASSRSHSLLAEFAVVSAALRSPPPAMLAEWLRAIAPRRRWRARLAWRDAESSRIRAPEPRSSVRRSLSHSCPTLRRPRLPWRVSSSGGAPPTPRPAPRPSAARETHRAARERPPLVSSPIHTTSPRRSVNGAPNKSVEKKGAPPPDRARPARRAAGVPTHLLTIRATRCAQAAPARATGARPATCPRARSTSTTRTSTPTR